MMTSQGGTFVDAFDWAVVRLATYVPASTSQARLLFGTVSLLRRDRPRPTGSQGIDRHGVRKGKWGTVFFRRTVLTARDAIAWYRSAGEEGITTPIPTDSGQVNERLDGQDLLPSAFEDDPPWPFLAMPLAPDLFSSAGDPAPFGGPGSPRVHRRFGDNTGFDPVLADRSALTFLARRVHLDLSDYTEYLGALALVAPDPVLRGVKHFLLPSQSKEGGERLVYRLSPHSGQSLGGLKLTIFEHRENLLSRFETVDVPDNGLVVSESGLPFDKTGYAIAHPVHGVLAYQEPIPFIRAVNTSLGIAGRKVKVEVPKTESPGSTIETYEVTEYAHEIPINVGTPRHDAVVKVALAEQRRIQKAAAKRYKQTWFDSDQRTAAVAFLRGQISRARSRVMVADPYFGARQILQFLHAVPRVQIDFIILSSRLAFESEFAEPGDTDTEEVDATVSPNGTPPSDWRRARELETLQIFETALATLRKRGVKDVAALILSGKTPPLHDRFLVIDDEVLFLGNSLNALGDRASLILSVPDSQAILTKLRAMVSKAVAFEPYASRRRKLLA